MAVLKWRHGMTTLEKQSADWLALEEGEKLRRQESAAKDWVATEKYESAWAGLHFCRMKIAKRNQPTPLIVPANLTSPAPS